MDLNQRLLRFARQLHSIEDFGAMVTATADEIREAVGYNTAWLAVIDEPANVFRILAVQGASEEDVWAHANVVPMGGDRYMDRVLNAIEPEIIRDAQVAPDVNRELVTRLGNRTIVNVPMRLVDQPFGALGTGTFGDEGVHVPSEDELAHLVGIAAQLVTAAARLVLASERESSARRAAEARARLERRQRIESLGELAGGVAHDFNNLLTVVIATTSLLQVSETDSQRKAEMQIVLDASTRAAELTSRLLALGKRQPLRLAVGSVNDVVSSVVSMLRRVIPADIQIDILPGRELPSVLMDAGQLEQVLMNLALNARDAMLRGGRLTIETEQVVINGDFVREHPWARSGRYALLTVTDTGAGMSDETLERIFEPFYTTKEARGGTGLGLAVCRGIIEQHGGLIHAYSEIDVGTTFKIYMPAGQRSARAIGTKVVGAVPGGSERILVADDQEQVRLVVRRILAGAGYDVEVVDNGALAVRRALADDFDLVILDAVMPQLSGRAAFDAIHSAKPRLPVLFASGYGAEELSARFLSDIDVPLLPKPFDPDTLLRTVRRILDS